ncbi:protein C2-DOMAIN ABA-RELATED 3-like [Lolium rigidum]|uniref:protein C2-DOMAIN ABA-RELATED 3-like n=1 Tax=Lolium rigidum TaxID=89674 RepID=UPI001F5D0F6B|nr:protein C2-DOMAIN ABA-RELATED 3-like [Lolium rigidum]XP_047071076.1 protein C2-DOMAIN ABA-RELATED 3-like [Lolium rigidum]
MDGLVGILKVRVVRGINLAYRDARGSDPYVVLRLGKQKVKTSVKKRSVNPIWHEDLSLSITNPNAPIKLAVFDKDTFSKDDPMGDAEIEVEPLVEFLHMATEDMRNGTVMRSIRPSSRNCLAEESKVCWKNGRFVQDVILRLKNVESGEIQLQLQWVSMPGRK